MASFGRQPMAELSNARPQRQAIKLLINNINIYFHLKHDLGWYAVPYLASSITFGVIDTARN